MQNNIKRCYGCNHEFTHTYHFHSQNVIIHHVDKRIRGLTDDGSILYGADFAKTYYHCKFSYISMKNQYFDGIVYLNPQLLLSTEQQCFLMSGNLAVKYTTDREYIDSHDCNIDFVTITRTGNRLLVPVFVNLNLHFSNVGPIGR